MIDDSAKLRVSKVDMASFLAAEVAQGRGHEELDIQIPYQLVTKPAFLTDEHTVGRLCKQLYNKYIARQS